MTTMTLFMAGAFLLLSPDVGGEGEGHEEVAFAAVEIFLDTGETPLAAYQLEFEAVSGDVRIVGIEGGAHPAFTDPPHYDPQAIQQDRVILASFNTTGAENLPTGRTRVARIHLRVAGDIDPDYQLSLTAAADEHGEAIAADAKLKGPSQ